MAYIGKEPGRIGSISEDNFTGTGVDKSFALSLNPGVARAIEVSIQGILQIPNSAYAVAGKQLVFSEAPALGSKIYVRYLGIMGTSIFLGNITTTFTVKDGVVASDAASIGQLNSGLALKAPLTGVGTSGTWPISISGNANTSTSVASITSLQVTNALGFTPYNSSSFAVGGTAEVGKYVDFHGAANGFDYDVRLDCQAGTVAGGGNLQVTANALICSGNIGAYSDGRLKDNIRKITTPLDILNQLDGVRFDWNTRSRIVETKWNKEDIGLIAGQVKAVLPEVVFAGGTDEIYNETYDTVDYARLVPVLIEAIKELNNRIHVLEAK